MNNDLPHLLAAKETTAKFLLLVNRALYRARFVTASAIHVAEKGEWIVELEKDAVVIAFPGGKILDSQNRGFVTAMRSVRPVRIVLPYEYPVGVSSLGAGSRYYIRFPAACSLTLECA